MMKSVKFGNRNALEIIDTDLKKGIKDFIWEKAKIRPADKNYRILNYTSLHHLKKYPHLATLSTYGKKFLLILLQVDDKQQTLFIDRKREMMVYMPMKFVDSLYQGTIFDGELIKDNNGEWIYFITDINCYRGTSTHQMSLPERIELVQMILAKNYQKGNLDFCQFQMKEYFPYQYLDDLSNGYKDRLKYRCSGLIFKNQTKNEKALLYIFPENRTQSQVDQESNQIAPSSYSTSHSSSHSSSQSSSQSSSSSSIVATTESVTISPKFKSVPSSILEDDKFIKDNNNFILRTTELPDVYELFAKNKTGELLKVGLAGITSMDVSKHVNQIIKDVEDEHNDKNIIVRCHYIKRFKKWEPICLADEVTVISF